MDKVKHSKIIILGSGPAGYTAAIYAARANLDPFLITGTNKGGQLMNTNEIENWPGDYNKISGSELMNRMYKHAIELKTKVICDTVISVNFKKNPFFLIGENNKYTADSVIIATGANPRYLGLQSESLFKGKGVSTCAVCDGFFYKNKEVAVVGGGNTAIEETLYLSNFVKKVHLIHRGINFRAEKILLDRLEKKIKSQKIIIYLNSIVKNILGNSSGVTALLIEQKNSKEKTESKIQVSGLFVAIGYTPNTNIFVNKLKMKDGYIQVTRQEHGNYTQTSIPGIFAAGDVIDHVYRQAITSSASGCMAALDSERYINSLV
ncbi:thioredoxin-disulfide reductase [Buchnera aphidicola str. APS (Acyrthosiphon pisum)]|uniref:Thioredoxin reductase n=1 Tax=Buchnera aphidicola subsp. Acyrthosiphon pisum (strain APS) TaxID=107806 RepID=TRXB_BUCAI|nr:thioredoxin-disulfide reductase [Buchnera aphidicola]P57399.1 RecName: Full=Thioredoxin reductase; Short=TRXR [Buchnera aphidicola str. APS (Acyrthosiphon pisum)]pir/F84966/ thioredoxin-disulfide reductase (EC 1.8.1.9) [imported] - Buchnera sp. (strain APS) [Buchnera sp. (in: enterobacteria)]ADP67288.1 thioredoxin reductase [Buchnera aphidicola str. JF99 (Acyrthosiphon pisum)]BAB13022.1 thioredoxin reductase [Buchnera aphidicola str. APS (Acyrthosiphon pisum)]